MSVFSEPTVLGALPTALKRNFFILAFARGMFFWYAIEKAFYIDNGITLSQIVLIGMVAQGAKVLFEIPTSVVADRWSRRRLLIFANAALIVASLIVGLGSSLTVFLIGILFWALYDALSSGIYEAFTYDSLAENKAANRFKKVYGRMVGLENWVLAVAGLAAGFMATLINFELPFLLSVIPAVVSIVILLRMTDPHIRRTVEDDVTWLHHVKGAGSVMLRPGLRWPLLLFISLIGIRSMWYEYYQLVGIDLNMSTVLLGALFSIILVGMAISVELAHRLRASRLALTVIWIILIGTHLVGLRSGNIWLATLNMVALYMCIRMLQFYMEVYIQHHIESARRATILSLASTLAYVWFFALVGIFTVALHQFGVRWAFTIAAIPMLVLAIVDVVRMIPWAEQQTVPEVTYGKYN